MCEAEVGRWLQAMTEKDIYRDTPVRLLGTCSLSAVHLVMSLFHSASLKLRLDVFSRTAVRIFRRMGKCCESHLMWE